MTKPTSGPPAADLLVSLNQNYLPQLRVMLT